MRTVLVTGSDTGVGKTQAVAALARHLAASGSRVQIVKAGRDGSRAGRGRRAAGAPAVGCPRRGVHPDPVCRAAVASRGRRPRGAAALPRAPARETRVAARLRLADLRGCGRDRHSRRRPEPRLGGFRLGDRRRRRGDCRRRPARRDQPGPAGPRPGGVGRAPPRNLAQRGRIAAGRGRRVEPVRPRGGRAADLGRAGARGGVRKTDRGGQEPPVRGRTGFLGPDPLRSPLLDRTVPERPLRARPEAAPAAAPGGRRRARPPQSGRQRLPRPGERSCGDPGRRPPRPSGPPPPRPPR